jgi:serine/threonine-protein kinase
MGSVWRAEHLALQAPVAVKLISGNFLKVPAALARFEREARAAASLRSPHVVQIFDHGIDPESGTPFIVMELIDGETLGDRLAVRGTLPPIETVRVVAQVARALARAHQAGIVHRDLKPDNVFLATDDDGFVAKVLDFGIAKDQGLALAEAVTSTGMVLGTAFYMSPEQISGSKLVDHRTDLWALRVIAFDPSPAGAFHPGTRATRLRCVVRTRHRSRNGAALSECEGTRNGARVRRRRLDRRRW